MEASGRGLNDSASLASPTIALTTGNKPCGMTFWYNMKGRHIGSLNVYLATTYGNMENLIWAKSGNQGKEWNKAMVSLTSNVDFQVCLEYIGTLFVIVYGINLSECSYVYQDDSLSF